MFIYILIYMIKKNEPTRTRDDDGIQYQFTP